jgi:hypothetical protein
MRVGRDHIASTVYTLVLAYAGGALPLLLLFSVAGRSIRDVLTGDAVAIEIARSSVGGIALALSVPLTTAIAVMLARPFGHKQTAAPTSRHSKHAKPDAATPRRRPTSQPASGPIPTARRTDVDTGGTRRQRIQDHARDDERPAPALTGPGSWTGEGPGPVSWQHEQPSPGSGPSNWYEDQAGPGSGPTSWFHEQTGQATGRATHDEQQIPGSGPVSWFGEQTGQGTDPATWDDERTDPRHGPWGDEGAGPRR